MRRMYSEGQIAKLARDNNGHTITIENNNTNMTLDIYSYTTTGEAKYEELDTNNKLELENIAYLIISDADGGDLNGSCELDGVIICRKSELLEIYGGEQIIEFQDNPGEMKIIPLANSYFNFES